MKILWRDTNLETHEIDLAHALDVRIDGLILKENDLGGLRVRADNRIMVLPQAANTVLIKEVKD